MVFTRIDQSKGGRYTPILTGLEQRAADVPFHIQVRCPQCHKTTRLQYRSGKMAQKTCCGFLFRTVVARVDLVVQKLGKTYATSD